MTYEADMNERSPSNAALTNTFIDVMGRVYLWMAAGLGVTAVTATVVAQSEGISSLVGDNLIVFFGLFAAQLGLVIVISRAIHSIAPGIGLGLFFLYSALMGVSLSVLLLVYDLGTLTVAFGSAAALFVAMATLGLTTKKDLTSMGALLFLGLIGLIITSVANAFIGSSPLEYIISFAAIGIFMGLTAYDSQRIKTMPLEALTAGETQTVSRIGVMGALSLYLDFINIALSILTILGDD